MNRRHRRAQWRARNTMGNVAAAGPANPRGANPSLKLHIDELILYGFPATSRHAIGDALRQEMLRLITNDGLGSLPAQGDLSRVDGGSFQVIPGTKPGAIGGLIARAVHGGRKQ